MVNVAAGGRVDGMSPLQVTTLGVVHGGRRAHTLCSVTTRRPRLALALAVAACAGCATAEPEARSPGREGQGASTSSAQGQEEPEGGAVRVVEAPPSRPPRRPADLPRRRTPRLPTDLAALHGPCPEQGCPEGMQCLRYCGVAGCRPGVVFRSCEIPCKGDVQCPAGLTCGQVADGPGRVCLGGGQAPGPNPPGGDLE
jgi:hypothetical protein